MSNTTLPNAKVLDKVYPGWRDLVANGAVNRFANFNISGAMQTSVFGVSSSLGSKVSATPGLQDLILASPYPNFAASMALSEEHYVEESLDGCFGTVRRAEVTRSKPRTTNLEPINFGVVADIAAMPFVKRLGWEHLGYRNSESGFPTSITAQANADWESLKSESNATYVMRAQPGTQAHSTILGLLSPTFTKLGWRIDTSLPLLAFGGNWNGQAAGNASHSGQMLTQYNRQSLGVTGMDLPGRKAVRFFVPQNDTTGYYGSYTKCYVFYIVDDGSNFTPFFMRNLYKYNGCDSWLYYGYDGRYYNSTERTMSGPWASSAPALLKAIYGDTVVVNNITYNTISLNDGFSTSGPAIFNSVNGSESKFRVNFTPLLGIPGALNYTYLGKVVSNGSTTYVVDDIEVELVEYSVEARMLLARLNYAWYELYFKTGFDVYTPRASNIQENVLKSWEAIKDYDITVCQLSNQYTLTEQQIKALPAYKEYARMRKKACKDNDFMSLKFDGVKTYQQILDASKPRSAFMQLLSDTAITSFSLSYSDYVSAKVSNNIPMLVGADGIEYPATIDSYSQFVLGGGTRVTAVETALGISTEQIAEVVKESNERPTSNVDIFSFNGDGSGDYITNRYAQTINGFPIYPALNPTQQTYLHLLNNSQYDAMVLPLIRIIQSLSSEKMWVRFK